MPVHFSRAGVISEVLNFEGHFSCSVTAETPNGIDDVGCSGVFDLFGVECLRSLFMFSEGRESSWH